MSAFERRLSLVCLCVIASPQYAALREGQSASTPSLVSPLDKAQVAIADTSIELLSFHPIPSW